MAVNGQNESAPVSSGSTLHISWNTQASEAIKGCRSGGPLGILTQNGAEWVGTPLPTSGAVDINLSALGSTAAGLSIYCWLGDWPQNAQFGTNIATDEVRLLDSRIGTIPAGPSPIIKSITPTSVAMGGVVTINGSGFTSDNTISFIGSTHKVSGTASSTVSPVDLEQDFKNVVSADGKTLAFTVPTAVLPGVGEDGKVGAPILVVPGIYYVVVQTDNGKSGVSYLKVVDSNDASTFTPPVTSLLVNQNLSLGAMGPNVVKLQSLLSKDPTIYPEASISGYFGLLTQKAVQNFQCKYKIVCAGDPRTTGYGRVGLNTRLMIEKVFSQ